MPDFPVVTEEFLAALSHKELVAVAMKLQQICLLTDDQLTMSKKLIDLQQRTIELFTKGEK